MPPSAAIPSLALLLTSPPTPGQVTGEDHDHGRTHQFVVLGATGNGEPAPCTPRHSALQCPPAPPPPSPTPPPSAVYTVTLAQQPGCTCPDFQRRGEPCKHMLFVMLRVLKLDSSNPLAWQKALLKQEVRGPGAGGHLREREVGAAIPPSLLAQVAGVCWPALLMPCPPPVPSHGPQVADILAGVHSAGGGAGGSLGGITAGQEVLERYKTLTGGAGAQGPRAWRAVGGAPLWGPAGLPRQLHDCCRRQSHPTARACRRIARRAAAAGWRLQHLL